jgi:hypothetical protein
MARCPGDAARCRHKYRPGPQHLVFHPTAWILSRAGISYDFPATSRTASFTFRQWAEHYFANFVDPEKHAGGIDREKRSYKTLEPFFGNMLLTDIKRPVIAQYRLQRLQQPIVRSGKIVTKDGKPAQVSFVTVNRKLSFSGSCSIWQSMKKFLRSRRVLRQNERTRA